MNIGVPWEGFERGWDLWDKERCEFVAWEIINGKY
jgi:hypothetical protein